MNAVEVTRAIVTGGFTNDELNQIILSVQFARKEVMRNTKRSLSIGSTVKYQSTKMGREITGKVTKIAIKFVTVDCGTAGLWKVPANQLTAV